jgi:hypothetical protein
LTPEEIEQLRFMATGQRSNLTDQDTGGSIEDYLNGPSMASVLLQSARGEYLRDIAQKARQSGTEGSVGPMIASMIQLDRQ